jgi:hypothetical protein
MQAAAAKVTSAGRARPGTRLLSGADEIPEYQAELDDTFDASEVPARLAGLAAVLIPAS